MVAVLLIYHWAKWESVSSHSRKPAPSTCSRDTVGRFWLFNQSRTAVSKCHLVGVLAGFICASMTLRACMGGRTACSSLCSCSRVWFACAKKGPGKNLSHWPIALASSWRLEPRGHFLFFVFHFSSKPCASWTRTVKERKRSSLIGGLHASEIVSF